VRTITGKHPIEFAAMHPFFYYIVLISASKPSIFRYLLQTICCISFCFFSISVNRRYCVLQRSRLCCSRDILKISISLQIIRQEPHSAFKTSSSRTASGSAWISPRVSPPAAAGDKSRLYRPQTVHIARNLLQIALILGRRAGPKANGTRGKHLPPVPHISLLRGSALSFRHQNSVRQILREVNKPVVSVILTVISLGMRVALAYGLTKIAGVGVTGIWISIPIGWFYSSTFRPDL